MQQNLFISNWTRMHIVFILFRPIIETCFEDVNNTFERALVFVCKIRNNNTLFKNFYSKKEAKLLDK